MRYLYPFAVVRSAVVSIFPNQFIRRLAISALLTGFDVSVLLAVLPTIREASKYVPWLATVFAVLVFGLIATLARPRFLIYLARGYIDAGIAMPVMLGVLIGSMIGSKLLVKARVATLKVVFGLVIVALGVEMIFSGFTGRI